MVIKNWSYKWYLGISIGLLCISISMIQVLRMNDKLSQNQYNQEESKEARVFVNEILLLLEQSQTMSKSKMRTQLDLLMEKTKVSLIYTSLSGHILYHSDPNKERNRVDLRYDIYNNLFYKNKSDSFQALFPVFNQDGIQIGNALFVIPQNLLSQKISLNSNYLIPSMIAVLLLLLSLLWVHKRKLYKAVNQPLAAMQHRMEAILREEFYETTKSVNALVDMDQFMAIFDQMCLYIQHMNEINTNAEKAQKELIANISHDIRTPLATIKAYTEGVLEGVCKDLPAVMSYMDVIRKQSEKMDHLVNDLFYHSLKQLGQISVNLKMSYSEEVFRKINDSLKQMVKTKGIEWCEPYHMPNILIKVDAARLEQVMENLVNNATKHTEAGGLIRLELELEENVLKVSIIDNGEGISPDDIPYVFDRFYQGRYNNGKKKDGAGLGLSICKYIVEAHGGQIFFITVKGEGTTFSFTLPIC